MEADDILNSLKKSGFDESTSSAICDYLQLINLETERTYIQEKMENRSDQLTMKLNQLFEILCEITGLNHTIPTSETLSGNGINDKIDLSIKVVSTDKRNYISLLWKSHNIHEIMNIPHGFVLGDLNTTSISKTSNETQIPILGVDIKIKNPEKNVFIYSYVCERIPD